MNPIKLLIVDDSPLAVRHLSRVFAADPDFVLVGSANSGGEGVRLAESLRPDVICMDVNMPDIDGFEATRRIMANCPAPIVAVSAAYEPRLVSMAFRALEAGAMVILEKPPAGDDALNVARQQEFRATFKAMAARKRLRSLPAAEPRRIPIPSVSPRPVVSPQGPAKIAVIGASTGGPQVIHTILRGLAADFPLPILIVQHMSKGFTAGFANWLMQTSRLKVGVAGEGQEPLPGQVWIAPEGIHMELGRDRRIHLVAGDLEHGVRPAVSRLFRSVQSVYGGQVLAVLLSGMGKDGAAELRSLREAGAMTIAQDQETSAVHGMPGAAIRLGGAVQVLPDTAIAAAMCAALADPA